MKSQIKKIPSSKPYFTELDKQNISDEIVKILSSGRLTQGPWIEKFEKFFAEYAGTRYAIATNSGTSAIEILLRYFDIKNAEVIVPTNTFLSTANAVIFAGGTPVLTDISQDSLCITLENIKKKVTSKTSGVIVVHIAGLVCPEIEEIRKYCKKNNLFVLEDAAHAAGASIHMEKAGSLADAGAFSFYPTKTLTTGEGGMITTNDEDCAYFAHSVRCHGIATANDEQVEYKNFLVRLGYNWRMSEIQAVIGYFQLLRLDEMISKRNEIASNYYEKLHNIEEIKLIDVPSDFVHSYYKFPVILNNTIDVNKFKSTMAEEFGIGCGSIYYPLCHLQPFYRKEFGYESGDFPEAEKTLSQTITLPIFPDLKLKDVKRIIDAVSKCI